MDKHGRKQKMQEEAQRYLLGRKARADKLVEKWSKTSPGAGLDSLYTKEPTNARNTAMLVENQERYLRRLPEAVISQNFQTRPENVLKVVRIGSANSNRQNIFTEFPLVTTDDAIFFIDMTYESTLRGATAGDKIYENVNRFYAGESYETSQAGNDTTTNAVTVAKAPIIPNKVHIMVDRELVGYDDGDGSIVPVGTTLDSNGTVNYTTGVITITSSAAITSAETIAVLVHFDSERSTLYDQFGKVSLELSKKRFEARPHPLGYTYSMMTAITLETTGVGDAEDLLLTAVGDEHAKSRDYKAIALARSVALTNTSYTFNANFAAAGEVSDKLHAQKLLSKVNVIGGDIYNTLKRGRVNKAVAGTEALEYMKKHDLWKTDNTQNRVGVYLAGSLDDIEVYCCPSDAQLVGVNEVILTFKNPEEMMDISLAFGVLTEIDAALNYPEFYKDGNMATVEDHMRITPEFVRLLTINNLSF